MNERFTDLLGWRLADGPFQPPYPWWPDPEVDPDDFARIEAGGAEVVQEPMDQPYGVRDCAFRDPSGNMLRFNQPSKR